MMNNPRFRSYQVPANPLVRIGLVLAGLAILALSFVLGIFVLAVLAGLAIIGSLTLAVRNWFLRRRGNDSADGPIDVEYRVIRRDRDRSQ